MAFDQRQLEDLRSTYNNIRVVDVRSEGYRHLLDVLNKCTFSELCSLESAGIKFVSSLARNRMARYR